MTKFHKPPKPQNNPARYQQQQSERRQAIALGTTNRVVGVNGTNYSVSVTSISAGSRDLCDFGLPLTCKQYAVLIEQLATEVRKQLSFNIARTIESEMRTVTRTVNGVQKTDTEEVATVAKLFTNSCLDEAKFNNMINDLVPLIVSADATADHNLDAACNYISQYTQHLRLRSTSTPLPASVCDALDRKIMSDFVKCANEGTANSTKLQLLFLLLLLLLIPAVYAVAKYRKGGFGFDFFNCCRRAAPREAPRDAPYQQDVGLPEVRVAGDTMEQNQPTV